METTGKFLARALKGPRHKSNILGIMNKEGTLNVTNESIAQHFHEYSL